MSVINSYDQVYAKDRKAWRKWLSGQHTRAPGVWLVFYKKASGKPTVVYGEAVEEALCFGWIDSVMRPVDDEKYMQLFTPRKPGSEWSKLNKERVKRMEAAGLMQPSGRAAIETAVRNGNWNKIDHVEAMEPPPDLLKKLARSKKAMAYFESLGKTKKKYLLHWLGSAKRAETRNSRIAEIMEALKQERMPARFA